MSRPPLPPSPSYCSHSPCHSYDSFFCVSPRQRHWSIFNSKPFRLNRKNLNPSRRVLLYITQISPFFPRSLSPPSLSAVAFSRSSGWHFVCRVIHVMWLVSSFFVFFLLRAVLPIECLSVPLTIISNHTAALLTSLTFVFLSLFQLQLLLNSPGYSIPFTTCLYLTGE